jgi:hypothetical protein
MLASSLARTVRNVEVCGSEVGEEEVRSEEEEEGEGERGRGVGKVDRNGDVVEWGGRGVCAGR